MAAAVALVIGGSVAAPHSAADEGTKCRGKTPTIQATGDGQAIEGTDGDDVIVSWGYADVIVSGGPGDDHVCGDPAVVETGPGDDVVVTVLADVQGGPGDDVLHNAGGTTLGGPGADEIVLRQLGSASGGPGRDTLASTVHLGEPEAGAGGPWETALPEDAPVFDLHGDRGRDWITASWATDGTHGRRCTECRQAVDGGAGTDTLIVRGDRAWVDLQDHRYRLGGAWSPVRGVENVSGTDGADRIYGSAGPNQLGGAGGADRIYGRAGADVLVGGPGRDELVGQAGADAAYGGSGRDRCFAEVRRSCTRSAP